MENLKTEIEQIEEKEIKPFIIGVTPIRQGASKDTKTLNKKGEDQKCL